MIVPPGTAAPTWTTRVKTCEEPAVTDTMVKVTVPVPPTAGVVATHPAGAVAART